jgi:hypothetical protein
MKLETQSSHITNPQFTGGVAVVPASAGDFEAASFENPQFGFTAGGLYVGTVGNITVKTYDGSVLTFVEAYGFIPGIIVAVLADTTTAQDIIALK